MFEPTLEGYRATCSPPARGRRPNTWRRLPPADAPGTTRSSASATWSSPGRRNFGERFINSLIIGFGSTFLAVFLGTLAAYGFSRFKVPLKDDLLFFILSTRMMPPIAVAIPIFLMYRELGLSRHPARA